MTIKKRMLIPLFILMMISITVTAGDWTKWRGPNGNGIIHNVNWNPQALAGNPKILWQTQLGQGYSSVAVKGNRLYAIGNKDLGPTAGEDIVYCFDAKTGKEIWRFTYPCKTSRQWPGSSATPVLDGNRLYTLCDDTGDLHCLNAQNGHVIWKRNVVVDFGTIPPYDGVGYSGSAMIEGNLALFNLNTSGIALNKLTGEIVWASPSGRCSFSTPVIFNKESQRKMALFGAKKFFVVDISTGKVEGSYDWDTNANENTADPIVDNDKVFISSAYGKGCALLQLTDGDPKLIWQNMELSNQFTSDIYIDGHIYGIDGERPRCTLKCVEYATGKVKWSHKMPFSYLIAANGQLIVLDEDGVLHIADATPDGYNEIVSASVQYTPGGQKSRGRNRKYWWTNPVLANGYLYARSDKGDLICLDVSK